METVNRKRSAVWNHFMENGPKKARCSYCSNELSVSGGNVGNLNRHLRTKHPTIKLVEERQQQQLNGSAGPEPHIRPVASIETQDLPRATSSSSQPSIQNYTQSTKPLPSRRAEQIDEQLVKMIAKGHYPFSMVEDDESKKLSSLLNPQYALPTRKTISESILPKLYNKCIEKVKSEVQVKGQAFCLTTDGWTSINNDSFIALTLHYISTTSDETKLKSDLIGCVEYNERHTSENLKAFLCDVMAEWNTADYTTAIASDNGMENCE
ncbi:unnamed protein product [Parnassius apollo]|uniref:(apollo) hypothetical protein n=1 Tax=Parnassius apollo TaxID=110799 RepID=A0A8S3XKZ6_PARAO|nr:unnamed protein product [Parnassius apollo]